MTQIPENEDTQTASEDNAAPEIEKVRVAEDKLHMKTGEEVVLSQEASDLKKIYVGVGWDAPPEHEGFSVDIDACAFLLNRDRQVRYDTDFIFYNNLETEDGCIRHDGDSRTGEGDGDDEVIHVDLERVPFDVEAISFSVTLHNSNERQQGFGLVKNAFMRIVDEESGEELAHFDLTEDASEDDAVIFGELVRDGMGWKFKALGESSDTGLFGIARRFGVNVAPV